MACQHCICSPVVSDYAAFIILTRMVKIISVFEKRAELLFIFKFLLLKEILVKCPLTKKPH